VVEAFVVGGDREPVRRHLRALGVVMLHLHGTLVLLLPMVLSPQILLMLFHEFFVVVGSAVERGDVGNLGVLAQLRRPLRRRMMRTMNI